MNYKRTVELPVNFGIIGEGTDTQTHTHRHTHTDTHSNTMTRPGIGLGLKKIPPSEGHLSTQNVQIRALKSLHFTTDLLKVICLPGQNLLSNFFAQSYGQKLSKKT